LAVDEDLEAGRAAIRGDARRRQPDAPLGEELTEPVRDWGGRFGVEDAAVVVCMQGRDARFGAEPDPAIPKCPVGKRRVPDPGIVDVDPDSGRNADGGSVHEHIEMGVDVMNQRLGAFRLQMGRNREL
jgi:hypothetical protein